jgi:hypothetical protein
LKACRVHAVGGRRTGAGAGQTVEDPVEPERLIDLVDAMPMRRQEAR